MGNVGYFIGEKWNHPFGTKRDQPGATPYDVYIAVAVAVALLIFAGLARPWQRLVIVVL